MYLRTDNLGRSEILTGEDADTAVKTRVTELKAELVKLRDHPRTRQEYLRTADILEELSRLSTDSYTKEALAKNAETIRKHNQKRKSK